MKVSCPSCQTNYNIDDKRIPPGGAKLKCANCQVTFPIKPGGASAPAPAIPLPGQAAPASIPLPGAASPNPSAGAAIPLPGQATQKVAMPAGAIPLPGQATQKVAAPGPSIPLPGQATQKVAAPGPAIPLPGTGSPAAIPLPGQPASRPAAAPTAAIPLPGQPSAIPLPGQAGPGAIPLPGTAGAIPLPGQGPGAIPLPGNSAFPDPAAAYADVFNQPTPLPSGPTEGAAYPPPEAAGGWDLESTRVVTNPLAAAQAAAAAAGDSIPLPSPGGPSGDYMSADDSVFEESTRVSRIPLPAEAFKNSDSIPLPGTTGNPMATTAPYDITAIPQDDQELLNAPTRPRSAAFDDAVPLPGDAAQANGGYDDYSDLNVPTAGSGEFTLQSEPPQPSGFDFSEPPPPETQVAELDFADVNPPATTAPHPVAPQDDFGLPPPPAPASAPDMSLDFEELPRPPPTGPTVISPPPDFQLDPPPPAPVSAPGFDFAELPPPPAAAADPFTDLGDLPPPPPGPPPAADFSLDFGSPAASPPPAAAAPPDLSFGEVDFGDPVPAAPPMNSPAADPLEFDPTASPSGPKDDLEADLSAPIPPPSTPSSADGLEMLSFIDDSAKNAGAAKPKAKRYHVRRRSGKVFGPFEEGVVVKMLEDGQLLGNEDVSTDSENWSGMGSVPLFAQTIQKLMESPSQSGVTAPGIPPPVVGASAAASAASPTQSAQTMDRLKQVYEGRMAAVAVVEHKDRLAGIKKRLPLVAGVSAGALVLIIGVSLGFTRYGFFGIKKLLPARISQGDAAYAEVQGARKDLLQDTFKSYKDARDRTAKVLTAKEYPEARAVWCQAIFYLQRRYAAASQAEMIEANAALERIELLGMKNADVVKAFAGAALARKAPDEALPLLEALQGNAEYDSDVELHLLLAEAYARKGNTKAAKDELAKVIAADKKNAKALHALGNLNQTLGDAEAAAKAYQQALEASPEHVASAVELAAVELLLRQDVDGGAKAVDRALDEKVKNLLGPAELARARTLRGVALAGQFKPKEALAEFDAAFKLDQGSVFTKAMLGRALLAQHDYEKALPLLKDAVDREPLKIEYTDGYLSALLGMGKMSDAAKAVEEANRRFPSNARIAYLYGRVSESADKQAEAETHYKRALAADKKLFEPNLALARLYLRLKRVSDAKAQLEDAVKKAPENAAVRAGLGELALAEKDIPAAQEEFKKSVSLDPNLAEAHAGLSQVALANGDVAAALAEVDKALELDKTVQDGHLQRGIVLWKKSDLDGAMKELMEAKKADPKSARVATVIGAVEYERGNLPDAEKSLLTAISAESTNAEPHYYLAQVRAKRLEFTQAIESMKNALEHAPNRADYHYALGLIYRDAKRMSEAVEEWKATLKLDPKHADAYEALGQAYLDRGQIDDAVSSFEEALKADPQRTRILGYVGDCYFQATKWKEAISRYKEALKADPNLTYVYYKLGRAFTEQGKGSEAIGWYQKATDADKDNPMPYYYLGYAYKEKGKRRDAVAAFKTYLAKKPNAEDKREIEDEIFDLEQDK